MLVVMSPETRVPLECITTKQAAVWVDHKEAGDS